MRSLNYPEARMYIHKISWSGSRPGLSRITELCQKLGNPQQNLKVIHVAGTNGKGSVCSMLSSVLRMAGYKTGLFTSPFVKDFNERICIDGHPISNEDFAILTAEVKSAAEEMQDPPTEFELITAIAFLYFQRNKCDVVVLEVGLGGRLDSTNIIESPLVSVITGIEYDHKSVLGNTLSEIAREKAGIIKDGCPVVFGGGIPDVLSIMQKKAKEHNSKLTVCKYHALQVLKMDIYGTFLKYNNFDCCIHLLGTHQPKNAAIVIDTIHVLKEQGIVVSEEAFYKGMEAAEWHARFEVLHVSPYVIFDGGHNPQGITACMDSIKYYFPNQKVTVITGVMKDKEYRQIAQQMQEVASHVFTVKPDNLRALDAAEYANTFCSLGIDATPSPSLSDAIKKAFCYSETHNKMPIIAVGSLYMYEEFVKELEKLQHI